MKTATLPLPDRREPAGRSSVHGASLLERPAISEDQLQIQVAEFLDRALPAQTVWWHVPNQRQAKPQYLRKLKRMGVKAGVPDIGIVHRGKYIAIELKRDVKSAKPTDEQEAMQARITLAGGLSATCRSLDGVIEFLSMFMNLRARA